MVAMSNMSTANDFRLLYLGITNIVRQNPNQQSKGYTHYYGDAWINAWTDGNLITDTDEDWSDDDWQVDDDMEGCTVKRFAVTGATWAVVEKIREGSITNRHHSVTLYTEGDVTDQLVMDIMASYEETTYPTTIQEERQGLLKSLEGKVVQTLEDIRAVVDIACVIPSVHPGYESCPSASFTEERWERFCDAHGADVAGGMVFVHVSRLWQFDVQSTEVCLVCVGIGSIVNEVGYLASGETWSNMAPVRSI